MFNFFMKLSARVIMGKPLAYLKNLLLFPAPDLNYLETDSAYIL